MAKAWLDDHGMVEDKTAVYYEYIVRHRYKENRLRCKFEPVFCLLKGYGKKLFHNYSTMHGIGRNIENADKIQKSSRYLSYRLLFDMKSSDFMVGV